MSPALTFFAGLLLLILFVCGTAVLAQKAFSYSMVVFGLVLIGLGVALYRLRRTEVVPHLCASRLDVQRVSILLRGLNEPSGGMQCDTNQVQSFKVPRILM